MRVLHVLAELNPSGAERMLACSYGHWRAAGVEPLIVGMAVGAHPFAAALADAGYEVILLPGVRSARGLAALRRTLRGQRPDVVHVHSESCSDAVTYLAALTPGVRGVVRTVHSSFRFGGFLRMRRIVRSVLARQIGVWVACSHEVASTERSYCSRCPTQVIENWVDVERISCEATEEAGRGVRAMLGIDAQRVAVSLIGNCGGAKNHELIPEAIRAVQQPIDVLHVGRRDFASGAERNAWRRLSERHRVHHLGERDDVAALLAASNLLALPSLYEGMGLVAAEALCAGVPVLAADTAGLQWLRALPSARLVPLDPSAWSAAIASAIAHPPTVETLEAAAALARTRFRPERGVAQYVEAYKTAVRAGYSFRRPRAPLATGTEAGR